MKAVLSSSKFMRLKRSLRTSSKFRRMTHITKVCMVLDGPKLGEVRGPGGDERRPWRGKGGSMYIQFVKESRLNHEKLIR